MIEAVGWKANKKAPRGKKATPRAPGGRPPTGPKANPDAVNKGPSRGQQRTGGAGGQSAPSPLSSARSGRAGQAQGTTSAAWLGTVSARRDAALSNRG